MYNLSFENATDIVSYYQVSNDLIGGFFGIAIVIAFFFILFITRITKGAEPIDAAVTAGFVTSLVSLALRMISMVNDFTVWITIILTAIAFLGLLIQNKE